MPVGYIDIVCTERLKLRERNPTVRQAVHNSLAADRVYYRPGQLEHEVITRPCRELVEAVKHVNFGMGEGEERCESSGEHERWPSDAVHQM